LQWLSSILTLHADIAKHLAKKEVESTCEEVPEEKPTVSAPSESCENNIENEHKDENQENIEMKVKIDGADSHDAAGEPMLTESTKGDQLNCIYFSVILQTSI
jgi:hypothetical protein